MKNEAAQEMAKLSHKRFEGVDDEAKSKYFSLIRKKKSKEARKFLADYKVGISS